MTDRTKVPGAQPHVFRGPTVRGMLDKATAEGEARGEARGEAKSRAKGKAAFLLRRLNQRGIALDPAQRQRIETCTNEHLLEEWFDRTDGAATAAEVFSD